MTESKQENSILDLDAFVPRPIGALRFDGETHPVFHPADLPYAEYIELVALTQNADALPDDATAVECMAKQISRLAPTLAYDAVMAWPMKKVGAAFVYIQGLLAQEAEGDSGKAETPQASN